MSAKATASVLSPPARSFTPAPPNLLQRQCACGGSAGLSGKCETCQQKTLTGQQPPLIQPKLKISQPNDPYEQEADRVANQVMHMPEPRVQRQVEAEEEEKEETIQTKPIASQIMPLIQRQAEPGEEEEELLQAKPQVQRQAGSALKTPPETPSIVHEVLRSSGQPLDALTRTFMESRFGHDFRQVQVHADAKAAQSARLLNAQAYTVGNNVVFGAGRFSTGTAAGRQLLSHELAHVVQQRTNAGKRVQRKIDKITTDRCNFVISMTIGIYGPRAHAGLARVWQSWINTEWSKEIRCSENNNKCPVRMVATVNAHPGVKLPWQLPEKNRVLVARAGYRSGAEGRFGIWGEDEEKITIAHEVGHLMGLIDRYWETKSMKSMRRFKNDIMANYWQDPGPTEFHTALARVLKRRRMVCPCCTDEALNGEPRERLRTFHTSDESGEVPAPLDPVVPGLREEA